MQNQILDPIYPLLNSSDEEESQDDNSTKSIKSDNHEIEKYKLYSLEILSNQKMISNY